LNEAKPSAHSECRYGEELPFLGIGGRSTENVGDFLNGIVIKLN
jgi:hypothetical protein